MDISMKSNYGCWYHVLLFLYVSIAMLYLFFSDLQWENMQTGKTCLVLLDHTLVSVMP